MIFSLGCITLLFFYVTLFAVYGYGWLRQKSFRAAQGFVPSTFVSVVIAARNEEDHIEQCVRSILAQDFPAQLFEVIVVDDCSTDDTPGILKRIEAPNLHVYALADFVANGEQIVSYKKKALATGIAQSRGALIVTTDADCRMDVHWLAELTAFYEAKRPEMIVAPVRFDCNASLVQLFQAVDFMTMQGITAATVRLQLGIMCNGANLAFTRQAFLAVGGYEGIDHLVSGDDYLLQLKIREYFPGRVLYLRSERAIVETLPQPDVHHFMQQRIRWASKTGKYKDPLMTFILSGIYLFNCFLLIAGVLALFDTGYASLFALMLGVKILSELLFLLPVAVFFRRFNQLILLVLLQPVHIVYIIAAGFLSRINKFEWKERTNISVNG